MLLAPKPDPITGVWVIDVPVDRTNDPKLGKEIEAAVAIVAAAGGGQAHLWIHDVTDGVDTTARAQGFQAFRDLWQLRCSLPTKTASTLKTRPFTLADVDALVGVNNRAFSWHPEQSGMTPDSLVESTTQDWFSYDGFRLFERDGDLLGFCWTKIHRDTDPELGEIYVIAVDPSAHGQGLGTPMTLAGLDWLAAQGLTIGMLYVESDNDPANATYRRIGFERHHTDRAYSLTIAAAA